MVGGIERQPGGGGGDDDDDDDEGRGAEWGDIWGEEEGATAGDGEGEGVPTGRGRIYGRGGNPGDLIILQTPDVHEEIEMLLKQLRRAQHIQVNVESRFLRVRMNFLEEIGFDWSEIDTTPDTQNDHGAELRTGLPLFSGEDYDNAQSFGLNVDFGVFDSFELQGLFRAIQTRNDVRTVAAPIVTLMNGQLGYLSVSTSYNYVSDIEIDSNVETSEGGPSIVTQDIDIETDNVADVIGLIVRPIVSADRKYVYLEAAPIVTEVLRFDKYTVFSRDEQENTIDLPVLRAERVESTVAVPDRGILLMGGLNRYTQDRREKGVPVFSKIPVLRRLFQSEGKNVDQNTFLILLRPRIIILPEEEERAF
jgi:type II secretory pathway component GspD/PulD (secretin)